MSRGRTRWSVPDYQKELEELEKTKLETGKVTQNSVDSTRRMLQLVDECQDAGINTLQMLHHQGETLDRAEQGLDEMDNHLAQGDKALKGMEFLKKVPCFLLPCYFCCCPIKKQRKSELKKKGSKDVSPTTTQQNSKNVLDANNNQAMSLCNRKSLKQTSSTTEAFSGKGHGKDNREMTIQRSRYFERITGDKEEDEIERNLGNVSSHVSALKSQAIEMGTTVSSQNQQIDRMTVKAEVNKSKLSDLTHRTNRLIDSDSSDSVPMPSSCPCRIC